MYKDVLRNIDNVAIWPVISFVIFFIFFLCLLWWVFTTDKNVLKEIEALPLNDGTPGNLKNENAELV